MKNERLVEFSVDGFVVRGKTWIGGKCYKGPLRIGDVFTVAFRYEFSEGQSESRRIGERSVRLEVIAIETYGHYLDEISESLSGQLLVSNFDNSKPQVGEILSSK